ncbi:MAG: beta-lactamase family protein [Enhydrobacter sp.]|nr:MAG: beta-lactamase family protein [Enhydrobacter sp.]
MDIAETLEKAVAAGDVPGVAAAAATDKGIVFEGAAGSLAFDSVIWIASMSKAITGAAAMQLVERGKLALDGPAAEIVPELGRKGVLTGFDASGNAITRPPKRPVTLRHLLTHTSGLGYDTWNADIMEYRQATGIPAVGSCQNAALTTPLLADPGERWEYGISIDWAGKMVEAASGQRLDGYLKDNIFDPLGMSDTGFKIGAAQRPRKARMHTRSADGGLVAVDHELPQDPEFHMGGGGLYSTVGDYLKFTRMILAGGQGVLRPETVALMSKNAMGEVSCRLLRSQLPHLSTDLNFVAGMKWGLSFMINPAAFPGRRSAGSLSWGGLANSYYWIDPVRRVTGVWATQLLPFYEARAISRFDAFEGAVYATL